jgi:hypothetical protein
MSYWACYYKFKDILVHVLGLSTNNNYLTIDIGLKVHIYRYTWMYWEKHVT